MQIQQNYAASSDEVERMRHELQAKEDTITHQEMMWKERTKKVYTDFEARLLQQEEEARKLRDAIKLLQQKADSDLRTEREASQQLLSEQRS